LGDLNPDRGEVPFMEEQFSIKVLESANPLYTELKGVHISEAISLRWAVKKFDLFVVGVARRESPKSDRSISPISRVLWGVPKHYPEAVEEVFRELELSDQHNGLCDRTRITAVLHKNASRGKLPGNGPLHGVAPGRELTLGNGGDKPAPEVVHPHGSITLFGKCKAHRQE
jgi:hypothetical protein